MLLTIFSLVLDAGVVPPGSSAYPYFVAAQNGLSSALCMCLAINGFVGFQVYEDGTPLSVWLLRLTSLGMFIISAAVSLLTFKSWAGLSPSNPIGVFVVLYILNAICLLVYVTSQAILVVSTLEDRWPLGDIAFGVFFFVIGQVILYVFSASICEAVQHYLDGLFFATICNLLGVMMVYKVRVFHSPIPPLLLAPNTFAAVTNKFKNSTGIRSPVKILNFPWGLSSTTGKSRSSFPKTISAGQSTMTQSTLALFTSNNRITPIARVIRRSVIRAGASLLWPYTKPRSRLSPLSWIPLFFF